MRTLQRVLCRSARSKGTECIHSSACGHRRLSTTAAGLTIRRGSDDGGGGGGGGGIVGGGGGGGVVSDGGRSSSRFYQHSVAHPTSCACQLASGSCILEQVLATLPT